MKYRFVVRVVRAQIVSEINDSAGTLCFLVKVGYEQKQQHLYPHHCVCMVCSSSHTLAFSPLQR